jgi:hypothetical protein
MLTVEIEHIDAGALESVKEELSIDVEPTPATLRLIQVAFPNMWIHRTHPKALHEPCELVDAHMKQSLHATEGSAALICFSTRQQDMARKRSGDM